MSEEVKAWCSETVKCMICTHQWVAVYPASCDRLECPHCGNLTDFEIIKPE
jgi:ribosomal protein S27E